MIFFLVVMVLEPRVLLLLSIVLLLSYISSPIKFEFDVVNNSLAFPRQTFFSLKFNF